MPVSPTLDTLPEAELDVTVVLPVHNEAGHLVAEVERIRAALDASSYTYEVIVVDDGSSDGSEQLIHELEGVRVIQMKQNRGSGAARRIGTATARGEVVVWTDVDMTYPNERIPELVDALEGYDHVVGARRTEEGSHRLLRTPAKWLIRRLAMLLTDSRIPDLNSGFRAFRRDVAVQYLHLLPEGFSCVTTITLAFLTNGYSVRYVDIDYFPRAGESKFHWWKDTRRYLVQVVRMSLMFNPLRIFAPIGVLLLLVGMAKTVYDIVEDPVTIAINTVVLLLAAVVTLVVAFLSDLVVQLTKPPTRILPAATYVSEPAADGVSVRADS